MNFLNSIVSRLLLLVSLPLVALLVAAGLGSGNEWGKYKATHETELLMPMAVALSDVVHNLQIERGSSTGLDLCGKKISSSCLASPTTGTFSLKPNLSSTLTARPS